MKTLANKKEVQGNLEELLHVKPKTEIIYQAIKYTGDNIHDIYRIFKGREIKFNVEDGWDGNLILKIKDRNANYYLTVGKYIISYRESDVEFEEVLVLNDMGTEHVISDNYLVFKPDGFYTMTFKTAKEILNIEEKYCKQEMFARMMANTIRNNVYDFHENYKFVGRGLPEDV